jgi:hypothetical protein
LTVALNIGLGGLVAFAFGGVAGLVISIVVLVVAIGLIATVMSLVTAPHRIWAAVCATMVAFVALGIAVFGFGSVPMVWVSPGIDLVTVLIAIPSALTLGLFVSSWRARIVGLVGGVALVLGAVWVAAPEPAPTGPSQAELQIDANFEGYVSNGEFPLIADLPGASLIDVSLDPAQSTIETADGGVIGIVIDRHPLMPLNPDIGPCWYILDVTAGIEVAETDTLEDYASWCVLDQGVWRLVDGTGYARIENGGVIAVSPAATALVQPAEGQRPPNAEGVLEAWTSLRPMTEAEVREHRDAW